MIYATRPGKTDFSATYDSNGTASAQGGVSYSNDDNTVEVRGEAGASLDRDGNANYSASASVSITW